MSKDYLDKIRLLDRTVLVSQHGKLSDLLREYITLKNRITEIEQLLIINVVDQLYKISRRPLDKSSPSQESTR